jgi:TRAP-type mannitol/chloroaromatic compound transport system substrate-binding protein
MQPSRRQLLTRAAWVSSAGLASAALIGCGEEKPVESAIVWNMVCSWGKDMPGLSDASLRLAELIQTQSNGKMRVQVHFAGERCNSFEVFDHVANGKAEIGHSASYYWQGKSDAAAFFCAVPFGLNSHEMLSWLYAGGGLELWQSLYRYFGLVPYPAGSTDMQMAGWFKRELRGVRSIRRLKIRAAGLAGEVLSRLGADVQTTAPLEIAPALESGVLDAAEWMGPWNDMALGLHQSARFYYFPGWQEPAMILEALVNERALSELPEPLRIAVDHACKLLTLELQAVYAVRNQRALGELGALGNVEIRRLPPDILAALRTTSDAVLNERVGNQALARAVLESAFAFREQTRQWQQLSAMAYFQARG